MADALTGTGTLDPADFTAFMAHVQQAADVYQDVAADPPQGMTAEQALRALTRIPSHRLTADLTRDERDRLLRTAHRSAPVTADERHLIAQTRTQLRQLADTDTEQAFTDHDILQALRAAEPVAGKNPLPRRAQTTAQTLLNHGRPVTLPGGTRHPSQADSLFGDTPSRDTTPGLALPGQTSRDTRTGQTPQDRLTHATNHQPPVTATRPTPIDIDSLIPPHFSQKAEQALGADAYLTWATPDHNPPAWTRGDQLPALTNQQIDEIFTVAEANPDATYGSIWDHINATYNTQLTPEEVNRLHHSFTQRIEMGGNKLGTSGKTNKDPFLEIMLKAAEKYYEKNGNLNAPLNYVENVDGKDVNLGSWISRLRRDQASLDDNTLRKLNAMNMRWEFKKRKTTDLQLMLKAAQQFRDREQHFDVSAAHTEVVDGAPVNLGSWLDGVRRGYSKPRGATREKLHALGMRQHKAQGDVENWLKAAEQYHKREGELRKIPARHVEKFEGKNMALGKWLSNVRGKHVKKIDKAAWTALDGMGMRWDKIRGDTENWLKAAEQCFNKHGDLGNVPVEHKEKVDGKEVKLGDWLSAVRRGRIHVDGPTWEVLERLGVPRPEPTAAEATSAVPVRKAKGRSGQGQRAEVPVGTEPAASAVAAVGVSSSGGVVADLAARRGLRVEEVPGDGDCFMASLARVLPPTPSGVEWSAAAVRREIATDLIEDLAQDPEQRWLWPLIETALRMDYAESVARQAGAVTQEERLQSYNAALAAVDAAGGVDDGYRRGFVERLATPGHWTSLAGDVAPALAAVVWGVRLQVVQVVLPPGGVGEPQESAYPIGEAGPVVHLVRSYERSAAGPVGEHWSPAYVDPELLAGRQDGRPAGELGHLGVDDRLLLNGQEPATEAENTQLTAYPDTAGLSPQDQADLVLAWRRQADTHFPWPDDPMAWEQDPSTAPWQPDTGTDTNWEPSVAGMHPAGPQEDELSHLLRLAGQEPATEAEITRLTAYPDTAGLSPQDQADLVLAWRQTDTHIPWPDDPMTWEQDPHTTPWQPNTGTDTNWEPSVAGMHPAGPQENRPAFPMVDPQARQARAHDFARAHRTLDRVTEPGIRDTLLRQATAIMQGRHQAPPTTPAEPGSAAAAYQSLHRDMTTLIAAHILTHPAPGLDITDPHHPARQLSEQLREELATHAPPHETAPPTTTGPFIGMALTRNDATDTLQQKILRDRLDQLTPGTPEHTRLREVLNTHTTPTGNPREAQRTPEKAPTDQHTGLDAAPTAQERTPGTQQPVQRPAHSPAGTPQAAADTAKTGTVGATEPSPQSVPDESTATATAHPLAVNDASPTDRPATAHTAHDTSADISQHDKAVLVSAVRREITRLHQGDSTAGQAVDVEEILAMRDTLLEQPNYTPTVRLAQDIAERLTTGGPVRTRGGSPLDAAVQDIVNAHGNRRRVSPATTEWISRIETGQVEVTRRQAASLRPIEVKTVRIAETSAAERARQKNAYSAIAPSISPYASRIDLERMEDDLLAYPLFAYPRDSAGLLPPDAVADAVRAKQWDLDQVVIDLEHQAKVWVHPGADLRNLTSDQLAKYPELKSYVPRNSFYDEGEEIWEDANGAHHVETILHADVQLTFHTHEGDKLAETRKNLTKEGISFLAEAGYALPKQLNVYIPKYSRTLYVYDGEDEGASVEIEEQPASPLFTDMAAEFFLPNNIVLAPKLVKPSRSGSLQGPPQSGSLQGIDDELSNPPLGTIVHELFHWLAHQVNGPFEVDLYFTRFADNRIQESIATSVSAYAALDPAEFIAEYATARLFGKKLQPEFETIYQSLGGPAPVRQGSIPLPPVPTQEEMDLLRDRVARITSGRLPAVPTWQEIGAAHARLQPFEQWLTTPERALRISQILLADQVPPVLRVPGQPAALPGQARRRGRGTTSQPHTHDATAEQGPIQSESPTPTSSMAAAPSGTTHRHDARAATHPNTSTATSNNTTGPHQQTPAPRAFLDTPRGLAARTGPADTTETAHAAAQATPHKEPVQEPAQPPLRRDAKSHRYLLDTRLLPATGTPTYTEHVKTAAAMLRGPDTTPAQQKTPPVVSIAGESKTDPMSTIQATDFLNAITRLPNTPTTIQLDLGHAPINICQ